MIPTFIRSYQAAAAIAGYRIVMFDDATASNKIAEATAATDAFLGVSDAMGAPVGGMCDVHRGGLVSVQLGASVSAGDPLTADASGQAIEAAPASGTSVRIIGFADEPGTAGDIIDAFMAPGFLHGA